MKKFWNSTIKEIHLDDIEVSEENVRDFQPRKGLEELKKSILVHGLLQPIIVFPIGQGQYNVLIGQRRYLACKELRKKLGNKIPALIIKHPKDYVTGVALSAVENLQRRDLSAAEKSEAITELLKYHGSPKRVADTLGLKLETIARWLKYNEIVPEEIKELVDKKKLTRDQALQLVAANYPNIERAIELAKALGRRKTSDYQRARVIRRSRKDKHTKPEKIVEQELPKDYDIMIKFALNDEYASGIKSAAKERGTNPSDISRIITEEYLDDEEYTS